MDDLKITVLDGDETGQELLEQALRVLDPGVTQVRAEFEHHDLSLENRRRTNNDVVTAAAKAMTESRGGG
jgi:isocitrate/isopropylmalate dehydrogenase